MKSLLLASILCFKTLFFRDQLYKSDYFARLVTENHLLSNVSMLLPFLTLRTFGDQFSNSAHAVFLWDDTPYI